MNGEIPSVPITTLAGMSSLSSLLPALPLPTPQPHALHQKHYLTRLHQRAQACVHKENNSSELLQDLAQALYNSDVSSFELIDTLQSGGIESADGMPALVVEIFAKDKSLLQVPVPVELDSPGLPDSSLGLQLEQLSEPGALLNGDLKSSPEGQSSPSCRAVPSPLPSPSAASPPPIIDPKLAEQDMKDPYSDLMKIKPRVLLHHLDLDPQKKASVKLNNQGSVKPRSVMYNATPHGTASRNIQMKGSDKDASEDAHSYRMSLHERVKRRRRQINSYKEQDDSDESAGDEGTAPPSKRKKSTIPETDDNFRPPTPEIVKKKRKDKQSKRALTDLDLDLGEGLSESCTGKRFASIVESVLENIDHLDLSSLNDEDETTEAVIGRNTLMELMGEAAKIKAANHMSHHSHSKLVKLLTLMQINIRDGCKVVPTQDDDDPLYREIAYERVLGAVEASLTAMYIMTSTDMPKQVYLEDVIERVVQMAKFQLHNTIYPEFDPVYRTHDGVHVNLKLKRARASATKHRTTLYLYNKLTELIACLAELIDIQELTDTIILSTSTLAVTPFFVENVSELQLHALKLVTSIFSRYEKHRQLIQEDILSSLARLPSSKKNLRSYRLNTGESIQMVTALTLQLIQCVIKLPDQPKKMSKKTIDVDAEVIVVTSYETAMRTAHSFLSVFLQKCSIKGEDDYRPLFENFVYDLLAAVNKPEWPASELLLSLMGRLLVQQFSNKQVDMSLRVASLDYLGIVAARLRKDAVTSHLNQDTVNEIISLSQAKDSLDQGAVDHEKDVSSDDDSTTEGDRMQSLQKALLQYLVFNSQADPGLQFAWKFYIAQWYRDCTVERERKCGASSKKKDKKKKKKAEADKRKRRRRKRIVQESSSEDECSEDEEPLDLENAPPEMAELIQKVERRKAHLLAKIGSFRTSAFDKFKRGLLDYEHASLATRYLASNRPFSQSFDIYLTQILKVLCENAVAVRTKAMKCLTAVVEADPGILARSDMERGVYARLLDSSTSVREAAVELVGKFLLVRPELTSQYYPMLAERILDTGISVRKRVIKIFRDICIEQPNFEKISEMCVKMIRRVNDEDGIKKLVNETFQSMWFTPHNNKDTEQLIQKVYNITDVISSCHDQNFEWFLTLVENLIKKEEGIAEDETKKHKEFKDGVGPIVKACNQLVDCLVENVLRLEEGVADSDGNMIAHSSRLSACLCTLHLFCRVRPHLIVRHSMTIQPYLNIKCNNKSDNMMVYFVAQMLERSVPLMSHPSESFLAQLEEDMTKLILKHGMKIVESCTACLGAVVNNVTYNYKLVEDCFRRFFSMTTSIMNQCRGEENNWNPTAKWRPTISRSLFVIGLFAKHFDLDSDNFSPGRVQIKTKDKIFDLLMFFVGCDDVEIQHKALVGLGFFCIRHYDLMLSRDLRDLYHSLLLTGSIKMRTQVLGNMHNYLLEEEQKMIEADAAWKEHQEKEDLKEMGDVQSGMASTVIQAFFKPILESFFDENADVRAMTLSVIVLVLRQGLVQPVQCVPYLVCMGTELDVNQRDTADSQLSDIDKKYPGFIQMKALQGIKYSYRLQQLIQTSRSTRGVRHSEVSTVALNHFIYSLLRTSRSNRRALVSCLVKLFDDSHQTPLQELVYMADTLAYLPYQVQDEPLFIIHQIDILVSVSGSNLVQSFQEMLSPGRRRIKYEDDEDEQLDNLLENVPEDLSELRQLYLSSQACCLLLLLKQHLKEMYGLTDNKIHLYMPTQAPKVTDKPLNRRPGVKFEPKQTLKLFSKYKDPSTASFSAEFLVQSYLQFKNMMMSIDPAEDEIEVPLAIESHKYPNNTIPLPIRNDIVAVKSSTDTSLKIVVRAETENGTDVQIENSVEPVTPQRVPKITIDKSLLNLSALKKHKHKKSRHRKKKKKKKKYQSSSEESEESGDSDPDFTV